jgi:ATP-dependent 26S proteasome regulatory subunit
MTPTMNKLICLNILLASAAPNRVGASPSYQPSSPASKNPIIPIIDNGNKQRSKPEKRRPRWLSSFSTKAFGIVKDEKTTAIVANAAKYFQYGIIAYLAVEVFNTIRDAMKELSLEEDFPGISSSKSVLSQAEVKKIITWLNQMPDEQGTIPSVSSSWMIPVALSLKLNSRLSTRELERILLRLTKSQAMLLQNCLLQPNGKINFDSIGGLSPVKRCVDDWISFNSQESSAVVKTPYDTFVSEGRQGLVLWGPPGCGKSLLIQAIAKKSRLPTLVVTPSLMQSKYYGESTNKVRTLFGLVSALGPCIVVLDELDGLFKSRNNEELEASRDLKTEWLQWWDGVASAQMERNKVMVVAATNRPWDCDPAVWRRLPQRFYVGVPNYDDRLSLVQLWRNIYHLPPIDSTVMEHFAGLTEGYIPSDLYQIFQSACRKGPMARQDETLTIDDVSQALTEIPPTRFMMEYIQQLQAFLSPPGQSQANQAQGTTVSVGHNGQYWQTPTGNYYQLQVPVDSEAVDALHEFLWSEREWESSDFDESDDDDDSDEDEL